MHSWKGLDISSEGSGISAALSRQVNLLGTLLGHVVREQGGEDIFDIVETLRLLGKQTEDTGEEEPRHQAKDLIADLNNSQLRLVLRSFTTFFRLINLAEQQEIIRVNRKRARQVSDSMERAESLGEAVWLAKQTGLDLDRLLGHIDKLNIQLTLMPHPTEARRRSILLKQQRIAELLATLDNPELTPVEEEICINDLYQQVLLLYLTDEIRGSSVTVEEDLNHLLHFASTTIWNAIPQIYEDMQRGVRRNYQQHRELPAFIHYRSWIGGDRDGKPSVTAATTALVIQKQRDAIIRLYTQELHSLQHELSISARLADIPGELHESINQDLQLLGLQETDLTHPAKEPYRRKVETILKKLEATARRSLRPDQDAGDFIYETNSFIDDIDLLCRNLAEGEVQDAAQQSTLSRLGMRARTFGFHFLNVDIKQHSSVHQKALKEIFQVSRIHDDYGALTESEKTDLLTWELAHPRPLLPPEPELSAETREVMETFQVIRQAVRRDARSISSYIISGFRDLSDLLEVLLLAKEAGLWHVENDGSYADIHLVPMFETLSDLEQAPKLAEALCRHPVYRRHLESRGAFQEVMLAYSESAKDGGILSSKWFIYKVQSRLADIFRTEGIHYRFHHGRGSALERGGGLARQAIDALPTGTLEGGIRFTEQGEIISFRYGQTPIARRHLEQIVGGVLHALMAENPNREIPPDSQAIMDSLAQTARRQYRDLVENDDFWFWYTFTTPIEHISNRPLSTHPGEAPRYDEVDFSGLNSNVWNFAWLQTGYNLPTWYGIGTALHQMISGDPSKLRTLQSYFHDWPFFRTLIENLQQELARVRISVAHYYTETEDDVFHDLIEQEYRKAVQYTLQISGSQFLLASKPVIAKSITLRNPYIDILNLIQVELIRRWRNASPGMKNPLLRLLLLSINGIAAAMQSTG